MNVSPSVRREVRYFLLLGIAGFAILPGVVTLVGTWMVRRGTFSPETWPSSIAEGYLGFFSLLWLRTSQGRFLLPLIEILVCFVLPYALFQFTRWTLRLISSLRVTQLFT